MANIKYLIKPQPKPTPISNPYGLIDLTINNKPMRGRPVAWDSQITDHSNLLNSAGGPVIPTRVITQCPDCNGGFEIDIPPQELECPICHPVIIAPAVPVLVKPIVLLEDPFFNPFETGVINFDEVNLDLIGMLSELPDSNVADRAQ